MRFHFRCLLTLVLVFTLFRKELNYAQHIQSIDTLTQNYLIAEQNLWHLVLSTNYHNREDSLSHIYETHEEYLGKQFGETGIFDGLSREQREQRYELQFIEHHLSQMVDSIDYINVTALNTYRFLNHKRFNDLPKLIEDIGENLPRKMSTICKYADYDFWIFVKNNSQLCNSQNSRKYVLSENQVLTEIYREIVAALLKGYMLVQMTYMIWTTKTLGNYRENSENLRENFAFNVTSIQDNVKYEMRNSSRAMWACDPNDFLDQESYIEISHFYQGYIDNEVNLNPDGNCRQTCSDLTYTKHYRCAEDTFCHGSADYWEKSKAICNGAVLNCQYFDGDLIICPAEEDSTKRYNFIKYDDGLVFGKEYNCPSLSVVRAESWWSWLVHCSNCFCYCDEPGLKSDRFFSLRAVVSNVKENKVITGVGITKINRIIQLQITEKELLPNGQVNTTVSNPYEPLNIWRTAKEFSVDDYDVEEEIDYHTLSWYNRSLDLDTIIDAERVVTGVRFRVVNSHIRLEVRFTQFDYQTGKLTDIQHSKWLSDNSSTKTPLQFQNPDRSTNTREKSVPVWSDNHFINFQPSDIIKDAAQSTVPFIDATPVSALTPLAGIGLYLKTQYGFGGFVAPKLIVFDSAMYITPVNNF